MEAKKKLLEYKKIVDRQLERYFSKKAKEARKIGPTTARMVRDIENLTLAGGKRLRAAFVYWGYLGAGPPRFSPRFGEAGGETSGQEVEKIVEASMSIELTHIFLLIHDDIIDRDSFRHGVPTIHTRYEKLAKLLYKKTDPKHFGNSMAIVIGDMAYAFGNEIIFNSKFSPERILKALDKLQEIVSLTVSGEVLDVVLEAKGKATEKEILEVHRNKTAKYTVEGPLHLGAMLAEGSEKVLKAYSDYAVPVGIAFQIQDDILGVFGNEKKLGKPVCSDLREGKQTLLVAKALEFGSGTDKKNISRLLGKQDVSKEEIDLFRGIVKNTGSLAYSQDLAKKYAEEGKKALAEADIGKETKEFLVGIADYIVSREA